MKGVVCLSVRKELSELCDRFARCDRRGARRSKDFGVVVGPTSYNSVVV